MEEALGIMPSSLSELLDEIFQQIEALPQGRRQVTLKTLGWLFYAANKRPLRMTDLQAALAIRQGQRFTDPNLRPSTQTILSCCRGLVTLHEGTTQVRLIHEAVRTYLQDNEDGIFPAGEKSIAENCITYLETTHSLLSGPCHEEQELVDLIKKESFLWYAASSWGIHAQKAQSQQIANRVHKFLHLSNVRSCAVQIAAYMNGLRELYWSAHECLSHTPLTIAANFGLDQVAESLLDSRAHEIDVATSIGTTPFIKACSSGYVNTVRLLLTNGADPLKSNWYGTSLHVAAEAGQCDVIEILLDAGTNINILDSFRRRPIDCALQEQHKRAVTLLASRGSYKYTGFLTPRTTSSFLSQKPVYANGVLHQWPEIEQELLALVEIERSKQLIIANLHSKMASFQDQTHRDRKFLEYCVYQSYFRVSDRMSNAKPI